MRRTRIAVAVAAAVALSLAGCSNPSSQAKNDSGDGTTAIGKQSQSIDRTAKGPAAEVSGAKKGGTITVYSQSTPNTFDPTDSYFTDSVEIEKLFFRSPTQYAMRDGKPVLVPDLTDLGTVSADGLTWTFKMQSGIKYADGSAVKVDDLAYAIKRSFSTGASGLFKNGPTYQVSYFKDGDTYKGPYTDGDKYAGVETPDANTLVIHLAKAFPDLPFYLSFPAFTPIPAAKDTKENYRNSPMATGPYQFDVYTPGTELKLKKNPYWDPTTDAVRHQYADAWDFKWGFDDVKTQQQVINSSGPDAASLNYGSVDATLLPQLQQKPGQLVRGEAPCTAVVNLDSRKIPLEVRKAIAKAYPYDQIYKAGGLNEYVAEPASTILPPSIAGYVKYPALEDMTGTGAGDPAAAKKLLEAAGKLGFEVSWYYDNTKPISQQTSQIRADAFKAAGFTVKPIGVTTAELRTKTSDYNAPVNMGQGPGGWCSDWPTGGSWFPVLFETRSVDASTSWGFLADTAVDEEIEAIAALPAEQAAAKWSALDQKLMGMYLVLPRYYTKMACVIGTAIGGAEGDAAQGIPFFVNMFVKS